MSVQDARMNPQDVLAQFKSQQERDASLYAERQAKKKAPSSPALQPPSTTNPTAPAKAVTNEGGGGGGSAPSLTPLAGLQATAPMMPPDPSLPAKPHRSGSAPAFYRQGLGQRSSPQLEGLTLGVKY